MKQQIDVKQFAALLDNAMLHREKSFDIQKGVYRLSYLKCAEMACDNYEVDKAFAAILVLCMVGTWNEAQEWLTRFSSMPLHQIMEDMG